MPPDDYWTVFALLSSRPMQGDATKRKSNQDCSDNHNVIQTHDIAKGKRTWKHDQYFPADNPGRSTKMHKQGAQGLGALLDKMEENNHINWITQRSRCIVHSKNCLFETQGF